MQEADIRRYAALMKDLELTGLEINEKEQVVRLERTPAALPPVFGGSQPPAPPAQVSETVGSLVKSPVVGMFYAAPAENAEPYVAIGDRVKKGQILCIVEAMKMMNEICAEKDGVIAEVCAANGQLVEYGTPLFRLEE